MKSARTLIAAALSAALLTGSAAAFAETSPQPVTRMTLSDLHSLNKGKADITVSDDRILFIGDRFCEGLIHSDDDALHAVRCLLDVLGATASSDVRITHRRVIRDGTIIYTIARFVDDRPVDSSAIKVLVDPDYAPAGLVSSIGYTEIEEAAEAGRLGGLSSVEAERIAQKNAPGTTIKPGLSRLTVLPVTPLLAEEICVPGPYSEDPSVIDLTADRRHRNELVWCIYTNAPGGPPDSLYAHYITLKGRYLYSLPVTGAEYAELQAQQRSGGTSAAQQKEAVNDLFDANDPAEVLINTTAHDGTAATNTVPVMTRGTAAPVLMDNGRRIIAADYSAYVNGGTIAPIEKQADSWDSPSVLTYLNFITAWDVMSDQGITGPDGENAPTLLLIGDSVSMQECGNTSEYLGRQNGFEVFAVNKDSTDGEALDLMGALYAHAVTRAVMGGTCSVNQYGAIRESLCHILGQLIQMTAAPDPDDRKWTLGDTSAAPGDIMGSPAACENARYCFDHYYVPDAAFPCEENDFGGVTEKTSILDYGAYRLNYRGMGVQDEFDFWMLVMNAITPTTGFRELDAIMQWAISLSGSSSLLDPLIGITYYLGFSESSFPFGITSGEGASAAGTEAVLSEAETSALPDEEIPDPAAPQPPDTQYPAQQESPNPVLSNAPADASLPIRTSGRNRQYPDGCGAAVFSVEETAAMYFGRPIITFTGADGTEFRTWPEAGTGAVTATLPAGNYTARAELCAPDVKGTGEAETAGLILTDAGWRADSPAETASVITVAEGSCTILTGDGLSDYPLPGLDYYASSFETALAQSRKQIPQPAAAADTTGTVNSAVTPAAAADPTDTSDPADTADPVALTGVTTLLPQSESPA